MKGVRARELVIDKEDLKWFQDIMFFMDINIGELKPGVNPRFVVLRYVCGEKKQKKMLIASSRIFNRMRA